MLLFTQAQRDVKSQKQARWRFFDYFAAVFADVNKIMEKKANNRRAPKTQSSSESIAKPVLNVKTNVKGITKSPANKFAGLTAQFS